MQDFITNQREEIAELCRKHHVTRLLVFGSAARDIDFDPDRSDVDLLVDFDRQSVREYAKNYRELEAQFVRLFSRKVDLVVSTSVKNPYVKMTIREDMKQIYAA